MGSIRRDLNIAVVIGVVGLALSGIYSRTPDGNTRGLPIPYTRATVPCQTPSPFNGCGFSFDVGGLALDILFWLGAAIAIVSVAEEAWGRLARPTPGKEVANSVSGPVTSRMQHYSVYSDPS